jgi:hypothetical protein
LALTGGSLVTGPLIPIKAKADLIFGRSFQTQFTAATADFATKTGRLAGRRSNRPDNNGCTNQDQKGKNT